MYVLVQKINYVVLQTVDCLQVGAEELDRQTYQQASEMRGRLAEASRLKSLIAEKLRVLGRQQRGSESDAAMEGVSSALNDAEETAADLLAPEIKDAREQLDRWKATSAAETKLHRALQEGSSPVLLSRAIQEATAAGVQVRAVQVVCTQACCPQQIG